MKKTKLKKQDKKQDEIFDLEDFDFYEDDSRFEEYLNKIATIFASATIGAVSLSIFGVPLWLGYLVSSPILGTLTIAGLNYIKKKSDYNLACDMQLANNIVKMFSEGREIDHKIKKGSFYFYKEIKSKEVLFNVDSDTLININQFLFLINENYYEEIQMQHPNLRREDVIDKILEQIAAFKGANGMEKFSAKEAKQIITGCIFLNNDLKKRIIKEFKSGEDKLDSKKPHRVLGRDFDEKKPIEVAIKEMKNDAASIEHHLSEFNLDDISWYSFLLKIMSKAENNEYGCVYDIEWDLFAIRDVMSFMLTKFKRELAEINGEFYNANVVMSFMLNVFIYASVNRTGKISIDEVIKTFKNWPYLNNQFELKLRILDAIFENIAIDYSLHPFRQKPNLKSSSNILKFPQNKE